jgi:hypothetical protein
VGFLERAERVVLLIIAVLTDRMAVALWIMAILTNWTAIQRTWYTSRELSRMERQESGEESTQAESGEVDAKVRLPT